MTRATVTRLLVGGFLAPESVAPGERVVVNAWVVRHPEATVMIDTGLAEHLPPEDVAAMRFTRTPIVDALGGAGLTPGDVDLVINCHLHADHAGGNPDWLPRLLDLAPYRVAFGHDLAIWQPDA
jgi:N-acyl homoserine lactone hydrolase